jgi:branched-chain amino acid transport system permease protein
MSGTETLAGRVAPLREHPRLALVAGVVGIDVGLKLAGVWSPLPGGPLGVERLVTLLWNGLVIGLGVGLAGIGLSMTYSILRFANFAHGDYVTTGAFAGWACAWVVAAAGSGQLAGNVGGSLALGGAPDAPSAADLSVSVFGSPLAVVVGLVVAAVGTVVLTLAVDRTVFKPMRDAGGIPLLIASIGVALVIRYLIVFVYGGSSRGLTAEQTRLIVGGVDGRIALVTSRRTLREAQDGAVPVDAFYVELPVVDLGSYSAEVVAISSAEFGLVVLALGLMYALHVTLQRTKLGTAMRATADNKDLARVTGIPTERVVRATWVIGGGLAGASGYLIALERGTLGFQLGWLLLLLIFAAVILGGIGSIYGAMIGGVLIGFTQSLAVVWIPSSFATAAAFAAMILVLVFRPEGIYGGVSTA